LRAARYFGRSDFGLQTLEMENNDAQAFRDDSGVRIDRNARKQPGEKKREELRIEGREDV
jgi:hypothetical protein